MKKSSAANKNTKMTSKISHLTWKEMYQQAYDSQYMDLCSNGTNAARALRQFDLEAEQHPQTRQLAHSPLERTFFVMGDECSHVNRKLWNFTGNKYTQTYPLTPITLGAMSGLATTITLLYTLQ